MELSVMSKYLRTVFKDLSPLTKAMLVNTFSQEAVYKDASGAIASFSDGANYPLKKLIADINAVQSGIGDPSPSNVRPISGWSAVNVSVMGKNLYDVVAYPLTTGRYINWHTGVAAVNENYDCVEGFIPISSAFEGMTINWNCENHGGSNPGLAWFDENKNYMSGQQIFPATMPIGARYLKFTVKHGQSNIMLYIGDAPTKYEPYTNTTETISLGQTVYGGKLNVTTGELTITHGIVDMGDLTWIAGATNTEGVYTMRSNSLQSSIAIPATSGTIADIICSAYKTLNSNDTYLKNTAISVTTSGTISIYDPNYNTSSSPSAFATAMTGQKIVYGLATPTTVQLTPTEVKSLLGQNNIWADSGNVDVTYRAI